MAESDLASSVSHTPTMHPQYRRQVCSGVNVPTPTFPFENQVPLDLMDTKVTAVGFLKKIVRLSDALTFAQLTRGAGPEQVQILLRDLETTKMLDSIRLNSAISVTGVLKSKYAPKKPSKAKLAYTEVAEEGSIFLNQVEISAENITCLNSFEKNIPYGPDHVYPPSSRHLQIRFDSKLRDTLFFRSQVAAYAREELRDFHEIETPILFKSTPEGAREFLVPTRKAGCAYALPQSPQQYKQMLMASGINKYVQFARCFRDEDLRADRQPEFTQIDLEMAWVDGEGVMQRVEKLIKSLYNKFTKPRTALLPLPNTPFYRMTYDTAMSYHGSDKPDLRIPGLIHRVDHIVPAQLRSMTTDLQDPIIEAWKIRLNASPDTVQKFIRNFFSGPDGEHFGNNTDGAPGICVFNSGKPLEGLQIFGFEAAEQLKEVYSNSPAQPFEDQDARNVSTTVDDGDLIILQARQNLPHSGGSTTLGKLRLAIYNAALAEGLIEPNSKHHYLWVTDFPMFTLEDGVDPGQGGAAGFSATHHPFTAPKTAADVDLLLTEPLKAKADHYDLVVNGVELGGGSRRIHSAEMSQERIEDFSHLLKALSAGCPPHAGFAIGFDRLIAVMCGTNSVRDVIAFPKSSKGDDPMVLSPRRVTKEELGRYKLQVIPGENAELDDEPLVGEVPRA
ncbi:Class II aaRS and biotin synthetase [Venustampulla echinocandica]|uniref:Class II aaRS and biotin synthetase n=1 Tax=Venustampulla echinocandica TaxID=2656787 RepID=A0A370TFA7_9HELO|nr:Class II aaRS and biotin synthetase [Venustampulla echinocandica]RDL33570.1 Class II aaRS and biotin synthetase [Venustampulla echinocandica]